LFSLTTYSLLNSPEPSPLTTTVTLQVDEEWFTTTTTTLCSESTFFAAMFSGRWPNTPQPDGSYFVDADPKLFKYILGYLRDGTLPLLYANGTCDHGLYISLLGAAKFFGIDHLQQWIEEKRFLEAVKTSWSGNIVEGTASLGTITRPDEDLYIYPVQTTKKVYVCPRGIYVHRGNPSACGKMCAKARADNDNESEYEEESVLSTLIISKKTTVDYKMCTKKHWSDASST
jgi:BTB/POZ domain-containing protein KCTD9